MKKMKFFLGIAIVAISLFFMSCNPTGTLKITVNPENVTAAPGETISFTSVVTPDALNGVDLGKLTISVGTDSVIYTKDFAGESSSDSVTFSYTVPSTAKTGDEIILNFTIVDKSGNNKKSISADITVGNNLITSKGVKATYISTTTNNEMMYVLGTTGVTLAPGSSTDGDLAFVQQDDYGYSIVSPDCPWIKDLFAFNSVSYTLTDKKNAKIMKYTGTWASLTADVIDTLTITTGTITSASGTGNGVQDLTAGDIVVYQTANNRKGALKVITNAKVTKYMTADFIYQANASSGK